MTNKLFEAVEQRLDEVNGLVEVTEEETLKVFTVRLPIDLIEKLDTLGSILEMKKTSVARMILDNSVEEIFEKFQIKSERHGMSYEDTYDIETGKKKLEFVDDKLVISEVGEK